MHSVLKTQQVYKTKFLDSAYNVDHY